MKIGTTIKDKRTGQYYKTVGTVETTDPATAPRVRVVPRSARKGFSVWTSEVTPVDRKDDPFRWTYAQWVLLVIAEVAAAFTAIVAVRTLGEHGLSSLQQVLFGAGTVTLVESGLRSLFGLRR